MSGAACGPATGQEEEEEEEERMCACCKLAVGTKVCSVCHRCLFVDIKSEEPARA